MNFQLTKQAKQIVLFALTVALLGGVFYGGYAYWKGKSRVETSTSPPTLSSNEPRKIAFLKGKEGDASFAEIWTVMSNGSNERSTGITLKNFDKSSTSFIQSPDFRFVCFEDDRSGSGTELYLLDLEGNTLERISNSFFPVTDTRDGSWLRRFQWSEDSKKILYTVSHHPHEFDREIPIKKDPPAKENWRKMGIFVYDVESKETIRLPDEVARSSKKPMEAGESYGVRAESWWSDSGTLILRGYGAEWSKLDFYSLSSGEIYKTVPSFSYYYTVYRFAFAKNGDIYGPERPSLPGEAVAKWDSKFKEYLIYNEDYKGANAPPVILSPDEKHIAFPDPDGKIIVVPTTNLSEIKIYDSARVDGRWSKYQWLSNSEILFWQSAEGSDYEGTGFYRGDLFKLNIATSETMQLTTSRNVFWRV